MDKVMINIQKYGNTTAATLPLCLWDWEDKLKKGDNIVLAAFWWWFYLGRYAGEVGFLAAVSDAFVFWASDT